MRSLPGFLLAATGLLLAQPQPKTIVYGRVGPSQIQLFVSNADGTAERPLLASDSLDYNPAWSPDGQWIVCDFFDRPGWKASQAIDESRQR